MPVNFLYKLGLFANAGVSEFTVEFDKGTGGIVGWFRTDYKNVVYTLPDFDDDMDHLLLDIAERKLYDTSGKTENLEIAHMASATKVVCIYDGHGNYSIHVVDESGPVCGGSETIFLNKSTSYRVFPMISFLWKSDGIGIEVCH